MKMRQVFDFDTTPVSLRSAWDISRACRPICASPISPFDLGARHQGGDRVDHDDVDAVGADEHLDDFERLLAVVGLRHEQVLEVDPQLFRVGGVERMFGVDEGRHPAEPLRFGDDLQRERGLTRGLGPEDLDHAAAGHAADAEGEVEADRAGGNGRDRRDGVLPSEPHDRTLAELLLNLSDGGLDGLHAFSVVPIFNWRHNAPYGCSNTVAGFGGSHSCTIARGCDRQGPGCVAT